MMVDVHRTFATPLDHETLWRWHGTLMRERHWLTVIGGYRQHQEPMQVVSDPDWLLWFAETVLEGQSWSERRLIRMIEQTRMFDRLRGRLNPRQEKALLRLFREEPEGFEGGLSADNYRRITRASASTATRDLADLVARGALRRTGERRHTRYRLNLPSLDP